MATESAGISHDITQADLSDDLREQLIAAWTVILAHETDHEHRHTAMLRQRELIAGRSARQVERMERERGLR